MTSTYEIAERPVERVAVGDLEIAYEQFGEPGRPVVLMVMGLGSQMIAWPDDLCSAIADAGHHVLRFDNRDVGLSTHLTLPAPSLPAAVLRRNPPYTISDMAGDAVGLLDVLGVGRAHLVGVSMGGFISQTIAIEHPARVSSLSLIMTSTGSRRVGKPTPSAARRLTTQKPPRTRDEAIAAVLTTYGIIGSPAFYDEAYLRLLAGRAFDRAHDPEGRVRQLAAVLAQPDRTEALGRLDVPTTVIHGLHDPLVAPSGGLAVARAVPGATFRGHHGMGHDLPRPLWDSFAADILANVAAADVPADAVSAAGAA